MIFGLSSKELEVISFLEFGEKYYFTRTDVKNFFKNANLLSFYLHKLMKKKRIIKLNRRKYFLVPIKAKKGFWAEHPFILVDEIMNGSGYFIGGSYAGYYWKLIEQIPREIDVFTTKRQGTLSIFNIKINFHRTTQNNLKNSFQQKIAGHSFFILNKEKTTRGLKW
ncbi:hypothetical protein HY993_00595 [Candidatus Micrarchaeota archaeon]|nr:hypothetical protein [Candidatus Micrarchaeota archaeon]